MAREEQRMTITSRFLFSILRRFIAHWTKKNWGHEFNLYFKRISIASDDDNVKGEVEFDFEGPKDLFYQKILDVVNSKIDELTT